MAVVRWYAVTTQPRHERLVAAHLQTKSIEAFLPLVITPSRWKDRRVNIERPIFPGYVFVRIDLADRHRVLGTSSAVRMLAFGGMPAAIEDSEIEAVRRCLTCGSKPERHPFLAIGEVVRVKSGVLAGLEGVVTRNKNRYRIVVSISLIQNSISAEVEADLLEPLGRFLPAPASPVQNRAPSASFSCELHNGRGFNRSYEAIPN